MRSANASVPVAAGESLRPRATGAAVAFAEPPRSSRADSLAAASASESADCRASHRSRSSIVILRRFGSVSPSRLSEPLPWSPSASPPRGSAVVDEDSSVGRSSSTTASLFLIGSNSNSRLPASSTPDVIMASCSSSKPPKAVAAGPAETGDFRATISEAGIRFRRFPSATSETTPTAACSRAVVNTFSAPRFAPAPPAAVLRSSGPAAAAANVRDSRAMVSASGDPASTAGTATPFATPAAATSSPAAIRSPARDLLRLTRSRLPRRTAPAVPLKASMSTDESSSSLKI